MKKWIEYMVKHQNIWIWNDRYNGFITILTNNIATRAQPEDLLGRKMAFVGKCGYFIHVIQLFDDKGYTYDSELIYDNKLIENFKFNKTYQKAFDAAWDKFLELNA